MAALSLQERLRAEVAVLVDETVTERVVVVGTLPPDGSDLDVLVAPAQHRRLTEALADRGFRGHDAHWAQFSQGTAVAVEVLRADRWGPSPAAVTALFDEAAPLAGHRHLARPAAHHVLLLVALRATSRGHLTDRERTRVTRTILADPDARSRAGVQAAAWHAEHALAVFDSLLHDASPPRRRDRAAATAASFADDAMPPLERRARSWLATLSPPPGGAGGIVALSGLDGSGKSSQATALVGALEAIGQPAAVEWARLAYDPLLDRVAAPVKRLLGRARARSASRQPSSPPPSTTGSSRIDEDSGEVAPRHLLLELLWAVATALVDVRAHRRRVRGHLQAGRVVVCDRYLLDSGVHLRERFSGLPLRVASAIGRTLTPRPTRAFYLRVTPETAWERKPQEFAVPRLRRQAAHYDALQPRLGVTRLDGTRPPDELAAEIGREVWLALVTAPARRWPVLRRLLRRH